MARVVLSIVLETVVNPFTNFQVFKILVIICYFSFLIFFFFFFFFFFKGLVLFLL